MTPYEILVCSERMTDDVPAAAIGERVRQALADAGISQETAAEAVGLTQPNLSRRITGRVSFRVHELQAVAVLCGRTVASLAGEEVEQRQ